MARPSNGILLGIALLASAGLAVSELELFAADTFEPEPLARLGHAQRQLSLESNVLAPIPMDSGSHGRESRVALGAHGADDPRPLACGSELSPRRLKALGEELPERLPLKKSHRTPFWIRGQLIDPCNDNLSTTVSVFGKRVSKAVRSDRSGQFSFELPRSGTYSFTATAGARSLRIRRAVSGPDDSPIVLACDGVFLGGQVLDERGTPLAGIGLRLEAKGHERPEAHDFVASAHSDHEGRFRFHHLPAGHFVVIANEFSGRAEENPWKVERSHDIRLVKRERRDNLELRLRVRSFAQASVAKDQLQLPVDGDSTHSLCY